MSGGLPQGWNAQLGCDNQRENEVQEQKDKKNLIEQGFTLIELLVVIKIVGILAAVVVFSVNGIVNRGKDSACKTEASTVQTAIEAFDAKNGGYPVASGTGGLTGMNNTLTVAPDKFLNSTITSNSPTQAAATPYTYVSTTPTFSVTVDGVVKTVAPSGTYSGVC